MNSPIAREELEQSLGTDGPALALPPATFTSPRFYEFELDAIWGREWFCVGRANEIPNRGDYYTIRVGHEPLIVVRRDQDEIAVLSAVCQHRGMILAEGSGKARRFRCPYHEWVYGLDGRLLVAPDMADDPDFDPSTICLPRIRSEIWEGFVFACFNPDAPELAGRLRQLGRRLASYQLSELKSAEPLQLVPYEWNWKIFGDECYHCSHLHAHTWHEWYPTSSDLVDAESDLNQPELGIIAYELHGELDAGPTRTGKCVHPPLPHLTEAERSRLAYVTVAPNLLIIAMPDKVKYFLWLPTGPTSSTFGAVWMFPDSTLSDPGFKERWTQERDDLAPVMDEDAWAWGSVQAGMFSRFAPRSRFAPTEVVIARLNRWLAERYLAADSAAADPREPAAVR